MKMHDLSIILKVMFRRELLVDMVTTKLNPHVLMVNITIVSPYFSVLKPLIQTLSTKDTNAKYQAMAQLRLGYCWSEDHNHM